MIVTAQAEAGALFVACGYLCWVPMRAWNHGGRWFNIVFLLAEIIGAVSSLAYLVILSVQCRMNQCSVCGCFHPKPLHEDGAWSQEDLDDGLMESGRDENLAVVQCHYNEPVEVRDAVHAVSLLSEPRESSSATDLHGLAACNILIV